MKLFIYKYSIFRKHINYTITIKIRNKRDTIMKTITSQNGLEYKIFYDFFLVTRYRRKAFKEKKAKDKTEKSIHHAIVLCFGIPCKIVVSDDTISFSGCFTPDLSPKQICQKIKHQIAKNIEISPLWTGRYIVMTEEISEEHKENFYNDQPNHPRQKRHAVRRTAS